MPFGPDPGPWCSYCGDMDNDDDHLPGCPNAAQEQNELVDWPLDEMRQHD